MPNTATAKSSEALMPAAPIDAGPSGPTMIVSTIPMHIQPISARTTGPASFSMATSSRRMSRHPRIVARPEVAYIEPMSNEQVYADGLLNRALDPATQPPEIRAFLQAEIELLDDVIADGMAVIDVGCGTGRHLAMLRH